MTIGDESARGTVILRRGGQVERYSMSELPAQESTLVREAAGHVLDDLDLSVVVTNLRRASDMLFVAYAGTAQHPGQAHVSGCQSYLLERCAYYARATDDFQGCCNGVLDSLRGCFERLLAADEETALSNLVDASAAARRMASLYRSFASEFRPLHGKTYSVYEWAVKALGVPRGELNQIVRLGNDLVEGEERQGRIRHDLDGGVARLQELRDGLVATARTGPEREFVASMLSAVGGVTGRGPGAYAAVMDATGPDTADGTTAAARRAVLQHKLAWEKECRSATADVARLVATMGTGDPQSAAAIMVVSALGVATWALEQVATSVERAVDFWSGIESGCKQIRDGERRERVRRASSTVEPAVRIAFYDTPRFTEDAVRSLAGWRAMQIHCRSHGRTVTEIVDEGKRRVWNLSGNREQGKLLGDLRDRTYASLQKQYEDQAKREAALGESLTATGAMIPG